MKTIIAVFMMFVSSFSWSQSNSEKATQAMEQLSKGGLQPSDMVYGVPAPPRKLVGDFYLNEEWRTTNILLYNHVRELQGWECKYDIFSDYLDFKYKDEVRVFNGSKVERFQWTEPNGVVRSFVNAKEYLLDSDPQEGFMEVLVQGQVDLVMKFEIWIKPADYIPALDTGNKDDKIMKREVLYLSQDGDLQVVRSKKDILNSFPELKEDLKKYMKQQRLGVKKPSELSNVVDFINELLAGN